MAIWWSFRFTAEGAGRASRTGGGPERLSEFGTDMGEQAAAAGLDHVEHVLEAVGAAVIGVGHVIDADRKSVV